MAGEPADPSHPTISRPMISIVGSCVSRDTLEVVAGLEIGPYVARTSLASIVSKPSRRMRGLALNYTEKAHPWHRRLVERDFAKTYREQFAEMAGGHVVIDLIEERVDLVKVGRRRYVTRSQILSSMSDFDRHAGPPIRIFSREGLAIWMAALPKFVALLTRYVPADRVVIHRALYAPGWDAARNANAHLTTMYDALADAMPGAAVVVPSDAALRSSAEHKWGPAPYHYVDEYYREVATAILARCGIDRSMKPDFTFQLAGARHPR